jgi:hypothetical protein
MIRSLAISALLAGMQASASAQEIARSQLVFVGEVSSVLVGQEGYCGKMERVDQDDLQKNAVPSGKRTWVRFVTGGAYSGTCSLDFSFVPEIGQAYIARYSTTRGSCQVEFFRIRPGLDPTREPLTPEAKRSCLLQ